MNVAVVSADVLGLRPGTPCPREELGGKAASLDRLVQAGFPVPDTAVVTASAYRSVAAQPELAGLLARLQAGEVVPADEVDTEFQHVPVPASLAERLVAAAREVGGGGRVAVRSSATVEDMADASFAGQYHSSLDVEPDRVLDAVRRTWASLWHPAPCAYRRAWGISSEDVAMPAVLMRMVPARSAGVAFTVDPGGSVGSVRVEAVPELGEALVSGDRTPEVWLLPRADDAPADVPPQVLDAAALALRVERAVGGAPQDVEWAWDGTRTWLVQARPITTGPARTDDGSDTPLDGAELTTAGIGETLPGLLPPLVWDVASFLVEEALRSVLGRLWELPADRCGPHEFVRRVQGRAALDLDLLKAAARAVPGGSEAELERQYFGSALPGADEGVRARWWRTTRVQLRAAAARRAAAAEAAVVVAAVDAALAAPPDLDALDAAAVLAYRQRLLHLGARTMTTEFAVASAAVAAYQELERTLAGHLGEELAAGAAQRVTTGAGRPRSRSASASAAVFAGPTWAERGVAALPARQARRTERDQARRDLEEGLRSRPGWRRVRILTGQVVDIRMHVLRRLITDATDGLARREQVKAAVLALGGEVRRVHLELGRRLVLARVLETESDVDLLGAAELPGALAGDPPPPAVLARRRRWLQQRAGDAPLPVRFTGSPAARPAEPPTGDTLTGWAASPGRYTGRARVVREPLPDRLAPGEVLVAAATDAGWSPLFLRAGAIVVERGGPLSHAAIVARELGLPGVLNLAGATAVLDGRWVTVDGDAGVVTVHAEDPGARS
ncbi:PEP-utilizing enzyme [Modestobacter sp. VKM Ac-2979]|uniref:PEP/pyruvate-binding domain-containing protein n=1 Tax=unclassified Modestobacter TaxID=2643866 RepID=UPI0022AB9F47|nr:MULTISPECIES: PEP/pyruvate-binding domain-containing protein [unclassified Modestobacter]MCZ2812052.1 PEP-utilizing enzyme [Modestobacter sp. VKM Ac-2979]MCZ2843776.1 PEP-utilizing enzyme [Modestobacter sp. VKM Ac-2980]